MYQKVLKFRMRIVRITVWKRVREIILFRIINKIGKILFCRRTELGEVTMEPTLVINLIIFERIQVIFTMEKS